MIKSYSFQQVGAPHTCPNLGAITISSSGISRINFSREPYLLLTLSFKRHGNADEPLYDLNYLCQEETCSHTNQSEFGSIISAHQAMLEKMARLNNGKIEGQPLNSSTNTNIKAVFACKNLTELQKQDFIAIVQEKSGIEPEITRKD